MPTPADRILASEAVSEEIIRTRLFEIYRHQFVLLEKDLTARLKAVSKGLVGWGGDSPAAQERALRGAIKSLKKRMLSTGLVNEVLAGTDGIDKTFIKASDTWVNAAAAAAPQWVKTSVPDLAKQYRSYIDQGSLIEKKLREGAYKQGGIYSQHARCFEKTRAVLQRNLHAGKNYLHTMKDLETNVWGVDLKSLTAKHRKGVVASMKRLIRTEYQYAHNSSRQDLGQANPYVIGYYITLDGGACEVCEGLYGKRKFLYAEDEVYVPPSESHPNCFTGDTVIGTLNPEATSRRWYEGDMLKVRTKLGREFTVTPNHPIFTPKGKVAISALDNGSDIFSSVNSQALFSIVRPDDDYIEATFQEIFELHRVSGGVDSRVVEISPEDFHNDGVGGEVGIINSNRLLRCEDNAYLTQVLLEQLLIRRNDAAYTFNALCACLALLNRRLRATAGRVRGGGNGLSFLNSAVRISQLVNLLARTNTDAIGNKPFLNDAPTDFESPRKSIDGFPEEIAQLDHIQVGIKSGLLSRDSIASVDSFSFSGHVFNLQNSLGLYTANGVLSSNCHCTITGYVYKKPKDFVPSTSVQEFQVTPHSTVILGG